MANHFDTVTRKEQAFTGEYGNASKKIKTRNLGGVLEDDIVYFALIPAGSIVDTIRYVWGDLGTGVTGSIGFTPVDPGDGPTEDLVYWASAVDMATAAGEAVSVAAPLRFDYDAYLVLFVEGAVVTGTPDVTLVMNYIFDQKDI